MKLLDFAKIYAEVEKIIDGWEQFTDRDKSTLKTIRDNYALHVYKLYNSNTPPTIDSAQLLISNIEASRQLMTELSKVVNFQAINDAKTINFMQYIYDAEKRMSLAVETTPAESRTLLTNINVTEPTKEFIETQSGLDLQHESYREMARQLVFNELHSVLDDLVRFHLKHYPDSFSTINPEDFYFHDVEHTVYKFMFKINQACSNIAFITRRGMGNSIVVGSKMLKYFENMKTLYKSNNDIDKKSLLPFVGTYGPVKAKVYLSEAFPDKIIIGYVGKNDYYDSSYVYASEIPILYTGMVNDPVTYEVRPSYMTRYHTRLRNKDYYRIIEINFPENDNE